MRYTDVGAAVVSRVLALYPDDVVGELRACEYIAGGNANTNYRVDTAHGRFLFKVCNEKPAEDMRTQARVLLAFRQRGVPVACMLATRAGDYVAQLDGDDAPATAFALFEWLDGVSLRTFEPRHLELLGASLASAHGIAPPTKLPPFAMGVAEMQPFIDLVDESYPELAQHPFVSSLRAEVRDIAALLADDALPAGMVHGDLFPDNTVLVGAARPVAEQRLYIVDWEEVSLERLVLDVAMTLVGCCFAGAELDVDKARGFLRGYQRVRPLAARERAVLGRFVRYCVNAIAFWRFRQFRVRVPQPERTDLYLELTQRLPSVERTDFAALAADTAAA